MTRPWSNSVDNRLYTGVTGLFPFVCMCGVLVSYLRHTRGRWGLAALRSLPLTVWLVRLFLFFGFSFSVAYLWLQILWEFLGLSWEAVAADCVINAPCPHPSFAALTIIVSVFATLASVWPYFIIITLSYPVRVAFAFWIFYFPVILVSEYFVYGSCLTLEVGHLA
jgi:hypothetical protein